MAVGAAVGFSVSPRRRFNTQDASFEFGRAPCKRQKGALDAGRARECARAALLSVARGPGGAVTLHAQVHVPLRAAFKNIPAARQGQAHE